MTGPWSTADFEASESGVWPSEHPEREQWTGSRGNPSPRGSTATTAEETTADVRDLFTATDELDAQEVAEKTIVRGWSDDASTSSATPSRSTCLVVAAYARCLQHGC